MIQPPDPISARMFPFSIGDRVKHKKDLKVGTIILMGGGGNFVGDIHVLAYVEYDDGTKDMFVEFCDLEHVVETDD